MNEEQYAAGGFIPSPGPAAPIRLDPDECVVNRDRVCIRSDHPTATSDGNQPGAWWVCEGPPT